MRHGFKILVAISLLGQTVHKSDPIEPVAIVRAQAAVRRTLKDPELAEFKALTSKIIEDVQGTHRRIVCGSVNTYSNGGFAGFQPFAYVLGASQLLLVTPETPADEQQIVYRLCPELR